MTQVTLKEIARKAGVSRMTVSKVINKKDNDIGKETREKVLRLAKELRYRPNMLAQSLRSGKTNTIAVVSAQRIMGGFNTEYEMGLFSGISEYFLESKYQITYEAAGLFYHPDTFEQLALSGKYDGVILVLFSNAYKTLRDKHPEIYPLPDPRIPMVEIENVRTPLGSYAVCMDSFAAGKKAAVHLIDHGYKSIGVVTDGEEDKPINIELTEGFLSGVDEKVFARSGISYFAPKVHTFESGMDLARQMIREKSMPRALFIAGEPIAYGMFKVCKDAGLRVPEDVAIIVNGDTVPQASALCEFTCLTQPSREKGRAAAQLLQELMESGKENEPVCRMVESELLIRKSCGCL